MANASEKRLASRNTAALNQLHAISGAVFSVVLLLNWYFSRSVRPLFFMSVPAAAIEYVLEKTGRPTFSGGQLVRSGSDLSQSGLTEYMHDVIYFTWICAILSVVIGNKAWYLYLVIPVFATYKAFQLMKAGKQMFSQPAQTPEPLPTEGQTRQPAAAKKTKQRRRV